MVRTDIVPTTEAHAAFLSRFMRETDRQEIGAATEEQALGMILRAIAGSDDCVTVLIAGKPATISGVFCDCLMFEDGMPWSVNSHIVDVYPLAFVRAASSELERILAKYGRLANTVRADNPRAIRWLRWLGYTIEAGEGEHHRYWMEKTR